MILYRIRDWNIHYETNDTRKLKTLRWVPIPNKHDGLTLRKIGKLDDGPHIFAAFVLMVQLASKCPKRGTLSQDSAGNLPLSPDDMGLKTGFPGDMFRDALVFLTVGETSWIEAIEIKEDIETPPDTSGKSPDASGFAPENLPLKGREGKEGKEGNIIKGWRDSFEIYKKECESGFDEALADIEWVAERRRYHPGIDIQMTMQKAFFDFWGTEAGWRHKKLKRQKDINWRTTINNAISMKGNQVYEKKPVIK